MSRFVICDIKMQWGGKYSHRPSNQSINMFEENESNPENDEDESKEVVITEKPEKNEIFVAEALKLAVLDKAGTKIVAGEHW